MIFISVHLPAPFSPSTAWISPGSAARTTSVVGDDARIDLGDAAKLEARRARRRRWSTSATPVRCTAGRGATTPCLRRPLSRRACSSSAATAIAIVAGSLPGNAGDADRAGHRARSAPPACRALQPLLELAALRQRADQAEVREVVARQDASRRAPRRAHGCASSRGSSAPGGAASTSASGASVTTTSTLAGTSRGNSSSRASTHVTRQGRSASTGTSARPTWPAPKSTTSKSRSAHRIDEQQRAHRRRRRSAASARRRAPASSVARDARWPRASMRRPACRATSSAVTTSVAGAAPPRVARTSTHADALARNAVRASSQRRVAGDRLEQQVRRRRRSIGRGSRRAESGAAARGSRVAVASSVACDRDRLILEVAAADRAVNASRATIIACPASRGAEPLVARDADQHRRRRARAPQREPAIVDPVAACHRARAAALRRRGRLRTARVASSCSDVRIDSAVAGASSCGDSA